MNPWKVSIIVITLVLASVEAGEAQGLRPGRYEVTGEMNMGGVPMKPPKTFDCVTPDLVKDLTKMLLRDDDADGCKVSDVKTTGNSLSFKAVCVEDGDKTTSTYELTYGADWYTGVIKTNDGGDIITIKTSGKRVGECTEK